MISAARQRKNIRTDESIERERIAKRAAEKLLKARGYTVAGTPRSVRRRHLIDVGDPQGRPRTLWFKLGWKQGDHGTSAVQITMLKPRPGGPRPRSLSDAQVIDRVAKKILRARADGITDLLLFSLDNENRHPIAGLILPIENALDAFKAELQVDSKRTRNGASPTLWIEGSDVESKRLAQTVERFASANLLIPSESLPVSVAVSVAVDDALEDFAPDPSVIGNSAPKRRSSIGASFVRDARVRDRALARADGICEYCGQAGFAMENGRRYLETHHIQALGEEGPDTEDNVIAVCANDHRAAHFSADRGGIAAKMRKILASKLSMPRAGMRR